MMSSFSAPMGHLFDMGHFFDRQVLLSYSKAKRIVKVLEIKSECTGANLNQG